MFLSTTEPVDTDGSTLNPTKSPCDRYVFNTVLTRAKSLVVVVGSPLVLLKTEIHMVNRYGMKGKCWCQYLKSCLERNTFIIPTTVESNKRRKQKFKAYLTEQLEIASSTASGTIHTRTTDSSRKIPPLSTHQVATKSSMPSATMPSTINNISSANSSTHTQQVPNTTGIGASIIITSACMTTTVVAKPVLLCHSSSKANIIGSFKASKNM